MERYGGRGNLSSPVYVRGRSIITCARRILTWPAQGAALVHDSSRVRPMPIMRANCSWYLSVGPRLSVVHIKQREHTSFVISFLFLSFVIRRFDSRETFMNRLLLALYHVGIITDFLVLFI